MNADIPSAIDAETMAAAIACLEDGKNPASPNYWPAILRLCDIERTIPMEARYEFYRRLSDHGDTGAGQ